ncbi:MAG: FtsW/RodA/SpoVE family cell cycle protein [Planctomycetes bacterium]|nr:FtsW/RodA/SpoVE family cell cycle protein [Planctomycetota bacterium]
MKTALGASRIHPYRALLVLIGLFLLGGGFVFYVSSTYLADTDRYAPAPLGQLRWIGLGLVAFAAVQLPSYRTVGRLAWPIYGACLVLLVATALFGEVRHSSRRWLAISGSIGFQPSELMKLGLLLVLARTLMYAEKGYGWRRLAWPCLLTLLPVALVVRQPDLGMALLYLPIVGVMVWASGVRRRVAAVLLAVLAVSVAAGVLWGLKDYQRARIWTFLAWDEARHGSFDLYQPLNARIAVANGGLAGRGLFEGPQNIGGYLPARSNDYIFAVIAEEGGLVACLVVLGLFYALVALLLCAAMEWREPFGRLLLVGVGGLLGTQVLVNTAVASGALPTTGLTLPLVSGGGSSLLTTLLLLGLAVNVLGRREVSMAPRRL